MSKKTQNTLSRRERQIMDIVYQCGQATVADVLEKMADPPSYSAVRALMGVLVNKNQLTYRREGARYVYRPTRPRAAAGRSALQRMVDTFYDGSVERTVAALLDSRGDQLSGEELDRLGRLIDEARKAGR